MNIKSSCIVFLLAAGLVSCKKKDTTPPLVTLNGDAIVYVSLNSAFIDPGATAYDDKDGVIPVSVDNTVDVNFAGTYYVNYNANDAAGNGGDAVRTVIVSNDADHYLGTWFGTTIQGTDTSHFYPVLSTSTQLNNRIWLVCYATATNATVYADLRYDTIMLPHQLIEAGSPFQTHAYTGSGFIKTISDTLEFEINYTDSVSGIINTGKTIYKKIN